MSERVCKCGHAREWHDCGRDRCQQHEPGEPNCSCRKYDPAEEAEVKIHLAAPDKLPPAYEFGKPGEPPSKSEATFFKEEVEALLNGRYKNMSVYQTVGALEVVKTNLLERLGRMGGGQ